MPTLLDHVRSVIVGKPQDDWQKSVVFAAQGGAFDVWEGLEALHQLQLPAPPPQPRLRFPPRTRLSRWEERPETPTGRFVRAISLDPTLDWTISDGAVRCLQLVMSLAGGVGRAFATLTSSIARQLGRTRRTIQNYWNELAEAGFIERQLDRKTGLLTVTVTAAAAPLPPSEKPAPWPRTPQPKPWWRKGGAKIPAHINKTRSYTPSSFHPVPGCNTFDTEVQQVEERLLNKDVVERPLPGS